VSAGVLLDTRDNGINAQRGWFASAAVRTFFDGFLGGDSTWQQVTVDVRTYRKLTHDGRQKLAFWFMSDNVVNGTAPYLDLPATGSDGRSARGYSDGRYRGEHLAYGEMEYRGTITRSGLLGMVAFVNTTSVDNADANKKLFDDFAPAAGLGLRVLLNKHSRTNLTADYGWGKDGSRGLYLGIQEAF
jgi:outer membrane protein assembly factor BamA